MLVSADDDNDLVIEDRGGLTVRNLASGRTWKLREKKATRWRIRPNAAGDHVVAYRTRPGTRCA